MLGQVAATLREPLRVRHYSFYVVTRRRRRKQTLLDRQNEFGQDSEARVRQAIESGRHCPLGGVFYRHHAELRAAVLDRREDLAKSHHGFVTGRATELPARSLVRESSFRPQVSHRGRFLQVATGRYYLAEHVFDVVIGQGPLVGLPRGGQHGLLPDAVEYNGTVALGLTYVARQARALGQQFNDAQVDIADFLSETIQF